MSLLEGELAAIIADGLEAADIPYDVAVIRETPGSTEAPYSAWNPGPATTTTHSGRGWVDDYRAGERDGTVIQANDRKVAVLAATLAIVPVPGDKVTARGVTYRVVSVQADPAGAVFIMQART